MAFKLGRPKVALLVRLTESNGKRHDKVTIKSTPQYHITRSMSPQQLRSLLLAYGYGMREGSLDVAIMNLDSDGTINTMRSLQVAPFKFDVRHNDIIPRSSVRSRSV